MELFKVMTFNVRGSFPEKHDERLWENRADLNVRTIRAVAPDVIGFQEVQNDNRQVYADHLPDYQYDVGREETGDKPAKWVFFNPIYWKHDRWERVAAGGFFLSETPDQWSKGWDSAFVRAATWVRLQSRTTGAQFIHLNTHFDHIGETARVQGAHLIIQQLNTLSHGLPVILTGDFNSRAWAPADEDSLDYPRIIQRDQLPPGNTAYKVFIEAGFRDTYIEAGHHNQLNMNTFHAFHGEDFPPCALRIDWVLIRDGDDQHIETESLNIIRTAEPPIYPSDHYPVVAEVVLT